MATKLLVGPDNNLQPFTLTFRSGAQEHYRADESTLSTLLNDWRAALAGTIDPKQRVRRYDLYYLGERTQISVLLDITALESVQPPQQQE